MALNTWAAKNLGPDADISRNPAEGGGGSEITVESLTVTENDTYTAPEGKAYSPVIVNVSGGSSDFSTATVTIVNNSENGDVRISVPRVLEDPEEGTSVADFEIYVEMGGTATCDVILYKGLAWGKLQNASDFTIAVTGDVDYDDDYFDISGAGTITCADA